jgi:hypothetical protein
MEVSGQLHATVPYPQRKSPWYPLDRRMGEHQSRSGYGGGGKNFQPFPGLEPPIIQPVAQCYTTELSRFLNKKYRHSKYLHNSHIKVICYVSDMSTSDLWRQRMKGSSSVVLLELIPHFEGGT